MALQTALLDSDLCRIKVVSEDQGFQLKRDRLVKPGAFGSPALSISGLQATCSSHEGCLSPLTVLTGYIFQPQTLRELMITAHA